MKYVSVSVLGFIVANIMACASTPPPPQLAPLLAAPTLPAEKKEIIEVDIKFENKNRLSDNIVQHLSHKIGENSSIVINVPARLFEKKSNQLGNTQDFKTKDFFNMAEQQIEKVLIGKGFRVLSRAKFEAKLRTLRDENRCNIRDFSCLRSQSSPEFQPILDELKAQLTKGEISSLKFAEEVQEFREKLQQSSTGKHRKENDRELTDISEVIRAAESGNVKADYILQINQFDTRKKVTVSADLRHDRAVRDFIRDHEEISEAFGRDESTISCAVVGATLNAKLIYVKTGEIVWIGDHHLNEFSSGVQNVSVELGSRRYVSNTSDIGQFISQQNSYRSRINRYGREVSVPGFEYKESLISPTVSAGYCNEVSDASNETKSLLARQVARELMNTIKVVQ